MLSSLLLVTSLGLLAKADHSLLRAVSSRYFPLVQAQNFFVQALNFSIYINFTYTYLFISKIC